MKILLYIWELAMSECPYRALRVQLIHFFECIQAFICF